MTRRRKPSSSCPRPTCTPFPSPTRRAIRPPVLGRVGGLLALGFSGSCSVGWCPLRLTARPTPSGPRGGFAAPEGAATLRTGDTGCVTSRAYAPVYLAALAICGFGPIGATKCTWPDRSMLNTCDCQNDTFPRYQVPRSSRFYAAEERPQSACLGLSSPCLTTVVLPAIAPTTPHESVPPVVATRRSGAGASIGAGRAGTRAVRRVAATRVEVARASVPITLEAACARLEVAQRPAARVVALRAVALLAPTVGQGVGAPGPVPVIDVAAPEGPALIP